MKWLILTSVVLCCCGGGAVGTPAAAVESESVTRGYSEEIEPYVAFLERGHASPVDYIMGLFERADIVVLGERRHPETTQYDLIFEIVNDPRFVEKVGHVFTEIGTSSMNPYLDELMAAEGLDDKELERRLLHLYRNIVGFDVYWAKYNFYAFLKKLAVLNRSLPADRRVYLHLSDMPFDWDGMTDERYEAFEKTLGQRDRVMADQIIARFREIRDSGAGPGKALVIMNYRHSFAPIPFLDGGKGDNVGRYLFEAFPGRVANVMLNTIAPLPSADDHQEVNRAVQGGKWDAAFAVVGNPDVGFDFASSPFGRDRFDLFPFREHDARYEDVYTGFVFYKPLSQHRDVFGIPGLLGDGFDEVLFERLVIAGNSLSEEDKARYREDLETIEESTYGDSGEWPEGSLDEQIGRWLTSSAASEP